MKTKECVEIKKSAISGKGVFALKDFDKDESILSIDGKIIEFDSSGHTHFSKEEIAHSFPLEIIGKKCRAILQSSPSRYLNHSCNPNAGVKNNRTLVAMKPIAKGEEIVIDYAICNIDGFTMQCKCGTKNCREAMISFEHLDKKTQIKYLPYSIDYIKKKIMKREGIQKKGT